MRISEASLLAAPPQSGTCACAPLTRRWRALFGDNWTRVVGPEAAIYSAEGVSRPLRFAPNAVAANKPQQLHTDFIAGGGCGNPGWGIWQRCDEFLEILEPAGFGGLAGRTAGPMAAASSSGRRSPGRPFRWCLGCDGGVSLLRLRLRKAEFCWGGSPPGEHGHCLSQTIVLP
ncbi:hypothetical protein TgHK011_006681 [Trichoderma gracile]|nr:hypothetical protein TgHK011_006681 [Trichoderma gracile]